MHNLPNTLKMFRLKNKFTQQHIADYLSITQQAYSCYEHGTREPDLNTLIKLAELFTVPLDILVGRYVDISFQTPIEEPHKKRTPNKSSVQLVISAHDNIVNNGNGNMYVKHTQGQTS